MRLQIWSWTSDVPSFSPGCLRTEHGGVDVGCLEQRVWREEAVVSSCPVRYALLTLLSRRSNCQLCSITRCPNPNSCSFPDRWFSSPEAWSIRFGELGLVRAVLRPDGRSSRLIRRPCVRKTLRYRYAIFVITRSVRYLFITRHIYYGEIPRGMFYDHGAGESRVSSIKVPSAHTSSR